MRWAKRVLEGGRLGRPMLASVFSLWSRDQRYYDAAPGRGRHDPRECGVLLNQAVHAVALTLWLMGHAARLTHDMAAAVTGGGAPLVTPEQALAVAELLHAAISFP